MGFAAITKEYIKSLVNFLQDQGYHRILEVCAGHGILGPLMVAEGFDWICTDIAPKAPHVHTMDALDAVAFYKPDLIFASWIPYRSTLDLQLAKIGLPCLFISEGYGGCIGSEEFWEEGQGYTVEPAPLKFDVPQWYGVHDRTFLVRSNP